MQNGQRLIVVVNGLKTRRERGDEARKLLEWGFRSFEPRLLFQPGESSARRRCIGGASSEVPLTCAAPVKVFLTARRPERLIAKIVYTGPLGPRWRQATRWRR